MKDERDNGKMIHKESLPEIPRLMTDPACRRRVDMSKLDDCKFSADIFAAFRGRLMTRKLLVRVGQFGPRRLPDGSTGAPENRGL